MKTLLALIAFLFATSARAELHLVELDQFAFEYYQYDNNRDGYAPYADPKGAESEHWVNGAAATFNLILAEYEWFKLYWDNRAHMGNTNVQVRQVGWEWEVGAALTHKYEFFWHHHSQHIMEAKTPERYPLQNYYGVRVNLYERDGK